MVRGPLLEALMRFARTYVLAFFSFVLTLLLSAQFASAQIPQTDGSNSGPIPGVGHDYLGGVNETVNPANGSVSLRFPVIMPHGRGITLPFAFAYDSSAAGYLSSLGNQNFGWGSISAPFSVNG